MKNLKLLVCILFLVTLTECSLIEDTNIEPGMTREYISASEDQLMLQFKTNLAEKQGSARSNDINWNEIYRVYDPKKDITTYTLYKRGLEENTFDNIVIVSKGKKQYSYTIRYAPNSDWLQGKDLLNNLDDFTGYISFLSSDNNLLSKLHYSNGVSEIAKQYTNARTQWCETVYEVHWTEATTENGTVQGDEIIIYEWEVCYNDSGAPTNSDNELDSGPESGGGGITPIGGGNPGVNDNDPLKKCPEGFKNENGTCISSEDFWEKQIDDSKLDPCVSNILNDLVKVNASLGHLLSNISGNSPYFNWETRNGSADGTAQTSTGYKRSTKTVLTQFDISKLRDASDLSIARTVLHEAVHAYLVYWYHEIYAPNASNPTYTPDYPTLLNLNSEKRFNINDEHHEIIAEHFIGEITSTLYQYSQLQGYSIDIGYIAALSWGGLEKSDIFKNHFTSSQESSISNVINIELYGTDIYGNRKTQKGNATNCSK